jgi:hypothetical protein
MVDLLVREVSLRLFGRSKNVRTQLLRQNTWKSLPRCFSVSGGGALPRCLRRCRMWAGMRISNVYDPNHTEAGH